MTAAERRAIKVLLDRATRSKLNAQAKRGARLQSSSMAGVFEPPSMGSSLTARPVKLPKTNRSWDDTSRAA